MIVNTPSAAIRFIQSLLFRDIESLGLPLGRHGHTVANRKCLILLQPRGIFLHLLQNLLGILVIGVQTPNSELGAIARRRGGGVGQGDVNPTNAGEDHHLHVLVDALLGALVHRHEVRPEHTRDFSTDGILIAQFVGDANGGLRRNLLKKSLDVSFLTILKTRNNRPGTIQRLRTLHPEIKILRELQLAGAHVLAGQVDRTDKGDGLLFTVNHFFGIDVCVPIGD